MYWKYHIKTDDLVSFRYRGHVAEGNVRGWVKNEAYRHAEEHGEMGDYDINDLELIVNSGGRDVEVNLEDVESRIKFEDRESDLPNLGEEFRFSKSVEQIDRQLG